MKHLFIPYELAIIAKEKRFDEPCFATYYKNNQELHGLVLRDIEDTSANCLDYHWENKNVHESVICAPLYQQIVDWFREKHKIEFYILSTIRFEKKRYYYSAIHIKTDSNEKEVASMNIITSIEDTFIDFYLAFNKAIEEAFKLI